VLSAAPASPLAVPGQLRDISELQRTDADQLFRAAFLRACNVDPRIADRGLLWRDGDNEMVLVVDKVAISTTDRLIVVSLPIYTDQSGDATVAIPFVTNPADSALGLIASSEAKPRGPKAVVDIFGDALIAVAWAALVETAAAWAAAAGEAGGHGRLAPAGLVATRTGFLVSAQGRFEPEAR
jgi:hypothetical protein